MDRPTLEEAAWELVERTTAAQGLPLKVTDAAVLDKVATILRHAQVPPSQPGPGGPRSEGGRRVQPELKGRNAATDHPGASSAEAHRATQRPVWVL